MRPPINITSYILLPVALLVVFSTLKAAAEYDLTHDVHDSVAYENPVVFVPGDGGSQLEAKLNKTSRAHYICDLVSDWYDLWLNVHLLVPYAFDCLVDNMKLTYDRKTRTTKNSPGVQIRPTKFGSLDSVDYLDILRVPKTDYFDEIISTLELNNGYKRNVNMLGAGFDFRKAPNELDEFFANLTKLIEDTYVLNNYKPVTLICHSMGCLNSVYLLNRKPDDWKNVFIRRLITLAAPWTGSFKAMTAMLIGDNLGIPLLNQEKLQELQSSLPSLMYLFPREPLYAKNQTLVSSPNKNYTLENLDDLFKDTGFLDQMEMWHDTRTIAANLTAPNVELWCLYGNGSATPEKLVYQDSFAKNKYTQVWGYGDGTVNLASLKACEDFAAQQEKPVYTRMFQSIDHIDILRSNVPANFISQHILAGDYKSYNGLDHDYHLGVHGENANARPGDARLHETIVA